MLKIHNDRWNLVECDIKHGELIVQDALFKKKRSFHVPMLVNALVVGQIAFASTSSNKIMQIDLNNAKRRFVSASNLKPEQLQHLFPRN
jgi:hypothetical protein